MTTTPLERGDVILVTQKVSPKDGGEPYDWRWFGVVVKARGASTRVVRIGADFKKEPFRELPNIISSRREITKLEPEDWPDGVHAFRMAMILAGDLDIQT